MDADTIPTEPDGVGRARATTAHLRHLYALAGATLRDAERAIAHSQEAGARTVVRPALPRPPPPRPGVRDEPNAPT